MPARKSKPKLMALKSKAATAAGTLASKTILPSKEKPKALAVNRRKSNRPASPLATNVPAFLLEGDEPGYPASGPGEKFSLGPTPPLDHFDEASLPLPESYGTGRLFLTARDPHWLYAHWDFTREEQFRHNSRSVDRHMVLRVYNGMQNQAHVGEYHVHPESKHWFVHVEKAGEPYRTELGYYQAGRKWKSLVFSAPQRTPPDNISPDSKVEFATIPLEIPFETMLALLRETAGPAESPWLARNMDKVRTQHREQFPAKSAIPAWSSEQEQALADILAADRAKGLLPSSPEFVSPAPRSEEPEFALNLETGKAAPLSSPTSYVSSFFGGETPKDFWFNVNAELVIYGATEPNATVTFAGKQIQLRPDGSFRFRFALPDGRFELPITAVSADGTDGRAAELQFARSTEVRGHVAAASVDPVLNAPPTAS